MWIFSLRRRKEAARQLVPWIAKQKTPKPQRWMVGAMKEVNYFILGQSQASGETKGRTLDGQPTSTSDRY